MNVENFVKEMFGNDFIGIAPLIEGKYKIAVPGYSRSDLSIKVVKGALLIKSADCIDKDLKDCTFNYKIELSDSIDIENVSAKLKHGLLTIELKDKKERIIDIGIE